MDLFASLPPEILPAIFGFLPLEDRKNVRLTCQSFRDACDRTDIIKHEKFVFHFGFVEGTTDGSYLAWYIGSCKKLRSAVEFRAIDLRLLPLTVWGTLGDRITSLSLNNCTVNDEIIAEILLRCSELENIYLDIIPESVLFESGSTSLDKLIAQGIERPNLHSFKLFASRSPSDDTFQKIFILFPNLRTFGRDHYSPSRHIRFNSASIDLPPSIENFALNTFECSSWTVPYILHPTHVHKYNELEITLTILNEQEMSTIIEFLSSQTELRRLDLRIFAGWGRWPLVKTVLFLIFEKCRKLEALKFHTTCEIKFYEWECADLVAMIRNFKSLDLRFSESSYGLPTSENPLPLVEYRKLTHLRWNFGPYCTTQLQTEILGRCRSLQSLCLRNVDDETLKLILRDLTKLKELSLDCFGCQDITCMEEYPFDGLRNLEYLDLRNIPDLLHQSSILFWKQNVRTSSVVALVSKLNCPKLKVFLCEESKRRDVVQYLSEKDTIKVLRTLAQKAPQLETLKLCSILPIEEYHVHCRNFKKLRHLVRANLPFDDFHMNDAYLKLFDACPSLMYVVNDLGRESNAHFYHRTTGLLRTHCDTSPDLLCEILNIPAYKYTDEISRLNSIRTTGVAS